MFSKLGRGGGGGRGGGKRPLLPPAPPSGLHRPAAAGARLAIGSSAAARNRPTAPNPAAQTAREETFSLVSEHPDFAAIIRLTPDIVDEIRRIEARGETARIKFASNSNNHFENVIDVGGKEFRFTWSPELGDLCDIYEERQSGEDGHGLLVECGSAWRKLNVQRILDESTKNHVKMRSEEAERLLKSRKAIVLDPANPSVKKQVQSMAAAGVDGSMRRMSWKSKKEQPAFKKRKVESNQVPHTGPPKPAFKLGTSSNVTSKGRLSVSPPPSPHEQPGPGTSVSHFATGNSSIPEPISSTLNLNKEEICTLEKEMSSNIVHEATHEVIGHRWAMGDRPMDLRSILITLLLENPKGMTLKALEKAAGETIPNSAKKIESIIKNIATLQAPGRYFLKAGVKVENSKRRVSDSGSSPESGHDLASAAESIFAHKATSEKYEQQTQLSSKVEDESHPFEKMDAKKNDQPDPYISDRKANNDSEGRACSSSESGSDSGSESASSDSGSDSGSPSRSRSKSKSKSPAGSGSASSSDSESDGSSSSKEGSDVEVEIMTTDDDKEEAENKIKVTESKLPSSPRACTASDDEHDQIDIIGRSHEGQVASPPLDLTDFERGDKMANAVEVTEDFPISNSVKVSENSKTEIAKSVELDPYKKNYRSSDERMPLSPDHFKQLESGRTSHVKESLNDTNKRVMNQSISERQTVVKDRSVNEQLDISERIVKSKPKRASDSGYFQEKPESAKRSKAASSAQALSSAKSKDPVLPEKSHYRSPDRPKQHLYKDHVVQTANSVDRDGNVKSGSQEYTLSEHGRFAASKNARKMQQSPDFWSASSLDAEQSVPRTSDLNGRRKALDSAEKSSRCIENFGRGNKHVEGLSFHPDESDASTIKNMSIQDKVSLLKEKQHKDMLGEHGDPDEKYIVKNIKESSVGDKFLSTPDSYNKKSAENCGTLKENWHPSHIRKSDMENSTAVSGKGSVLRRELSDLELGEFREPSSGEEPCGVKEQFQRKSSFKSLENRVTANDNTNTSKGRTLANAPFELKKQSPAHLRAEIHGNQDVFNKRVPIDDLMDSTRSQQRAIQQLSRVDHTGTEAISHLDKPAELSGRNESRTSQGMGLENHAGTHKKISASIQLQKDNKHGDRMINKDVKESKPQKSNGLRDSTDRSNNGFLMENDSYGAKRRESSSDEDNSFYLKYDKDKPELKGPIQDFLQYKEYVQEYREKYDHYCSLNKNLLKIRNDFLKVGNDLEDAKGRDMEYCSIVEQLKEMYHRCGTKQKQMKKAFLLLHEELKNLKQRIRDFAQAYTKE